MLLSRFFFGAGLVAAGAAASGAQAPTDLPRPLPAAGTIAFVDVSVIPMDRDRVVDHQTVIVKNGRIAAMGPAASVAVPADAQRIPAAGKYLMPGLVDMHAHFSPGTETIDSPAGQQLALFLGTGFTTVRGLGGSVATALGLRDRINRGEVLGPRFVVASPSVNGQSARTIADVVSQVEAAKKAGYDLVKTHGMFPSAAYYDSLVAATKRVGLPLVGHITPEYGLERAIAAHQQIEHLDGYIGAMLEDGIPAPPGQILADPDLLARIDRKKMQAAVDKTVAMGIWNGPTIALFETITSDETPEQLALRPEMRYVPPAMLQQFMQQKASTMMIPVEGRHGFIELRRELLRSLYKSGAKLLVGSDSPQFFMIPGYSALREIEAFVGAGLPPFAALAAATRNPAEFLGWAGDAGTVETGKRADLILLDANPLASIANIHALNGVMVNGRWLDAGRLAALRDAVAGAVAPHR